MNAYKLFGDDAPIVVSSSEPPIWLNGREMEIPLSKKLSKKFEELFFPIIPLSPIVSIAPNGRIKHFQDDVTDRFTQEEREELQRVLGLGELLS